MLNALEYLCFKSNDSKTEKRDNESGDFKSQMKDHPMRHHLQLQALAKNITMAAVVSLIVSATGCAQLKDRFGTPEQTPQLSKDRNSCHDQSEKEVAQLGLSAIKRQDVKRNAYRACMKKKGYNRFDKKITP